MTSKDIRSTISSPASAAGAVRYDSRIGPIIEKFGLEAVLASLSPSRAKEVGLLTTGTSGRISDISSRSDALQSSLESRLRQRLNGSDLCEVIWKPWTTPWGQCLSRPRARVRTTCEIGSGLWATIRATDGAKGGPNMSFGAGGQPLPAMAAWSTPRASPNENRTTKATPAQLAGKHGQYLAVQALTAGVWQTPVADDAPDREKGKINSRGEAKLSGQAVQATWPTTTTTTRDHKDGHYQPNVPINGLLGRMVWPPPTSLAKSTDTNNEAGNSAGLVAIRKHAMASHGSSAPTEKRGALNPEFVCWLMGYPIEWVNCAGSETRLTRARRQRSSKA